MPPTTITPDHAAAADATISRYLDSSVHLEPLERRRLLSELGIELEAVVRRLLLAGRAPAQIGRDLGLQTQDDVVVLPQWHADDGNAEVLCEATHAAAAAQEYVAGGDWGVRHKSSWVHVWVWRVGLYAEEGSVAECVVDRTRHTVEIEPDEPGCSEPDVEHCWVSPHDLLGGCPSNPGVTGHGGGVVITEVCRHCGRYRVTDTWAQVPDTGEQGLHSVEYREADEASLAWVEADDALQPET